MPESSSALLRRLGRGESIASVCELARWTRAEFDSWWADECRRRVPAARGVATVAGLQSSVRVVRDSRGVPHVLADNDRDLFYGFGYAVAQDRLFQLDFVRRKARGRLAEVLGAEAVESDLLYRTLDIAALVTREFAELPDDVRVLLNAYAEGVNAWREACTDNPPIEFDLLDYRPESWSPMDSLAIAAEFRWYLTGRFPVIVVPELVKRAVGGGRLYEAFLVAEVDDESIMPPGSYVAAPRPAGAPSFGGHSGESGPGSNNWVLAAERTQTGRPLLASDPHVPFQAVSLWHEAHLRGGSYNVAGVALAGMPAVMIGRNERVAWGVTNNISSLRDLYQERLDPSDSHRVWYDGAWESIAEREVVIEVRDAAPVRHTVRKTRTGPLVDQLLPAPARHTGPVSLRWMGFESCGWLTALVRGNRARSAAEFRGALEPWAVPTFNVVMADVDGHIGYQCTGRIPRRRVRERGYRPGWDPTHQWDGAVPWPEMPRLVDPEPKFIVTANNRICPDDYPQPLSGTWVTGYRARRLRQAIELRPTLTRDEHQQLQLDVHSGRAAACVPHILALMGDDADPRVKEMLARLANWDFHVRADSVAAAVFNVFFSQWCRVITAVRLPAEQVELVAAAAGPLGVDLLAGDPHGWLDGHNRRDLVRRAMLAAIDELTLRFGSNVDGWQWGQLHVLLQKHPLSGRGELGALLDHERLPLGGDAHTVNSSSPDATHAAWLGATYRFVADLSDPRAGFWSVESGSVSGVPGGPHYSDQLSTWHAGRMYYLPLKGDIEGETFELR